MCILIKVVQKFFFYFSIKTLNGKFLKALNGKMNVLSYAIRQSSESMIGIIFETVSKIDVLLYLDENREEGGIFDTFSLQ